MAEGEGSAGALTGRVIGGKYRIDAQLGAGMMGVVYRATQLNLERPVAIKVIRVDALSNPTAAERFKREALAIARLKHAHIITIYDFGVAPEIGGYLVMEYLEGASLRDAIKAEVRLAPAAAVDLMRQVCSAVHSAHEAGVIHRDLKPHNIFLEDSAEGPSAKVLDFGVAKLHLTDDGESASLTVSGALVGTPLYISPEQCGGLPLDARSDVYSLGCVLYEMLTGRPPFLGGSIASVLVKQMSETPKPPSALAPGVPPALDAVVLKALAKQPTERYQTALSFGQALASLATGPRDAVAGEAEGGGAQRRPGVPTSETPALATGTGHAPPTNLPQQVTALVGRETQVHDVRALLGSTRLLTLLGLGGIGKTRLAVEVAAESAGDFPDGIWLVDLAPLADPALVDGAVASAVGARVRGVATEREALVEALRPSQTLLLLDNCEHVVAACASLVEELLLACPSLRVLATSREALGIVGEAVWRVPALTVPAPGGDVEAILASESARFFVERVRLNKPGFELTPKNAAAVAELLGRLEGIPLAIELAAARAKVLSIDQIRARMDDRFGLLVGGGRTTLRRQLSLRATIDWSYGLLSREERALLRRLSVFPDGWTLEGAEAVCAGDGIDEADVLDLLTQLVDKSLVTADESEGEGRYRMLETIRQYALEKAGATDDAARSLERYESWASSHAGEA